MFTIPTDSRMDFDYSVTTENRFALRNWLEQFIVAVNDNDVEKYSAMISPVFVARGFIDEEMDRELFLQFLKSPNKKKSSRVIRLPELRIKLQAGTYRIAGTFEQFNDGIISYEGTIEVAISHYDEVFAFEKIIFFPRLKLSEK